MLARNTQDQMIRRDAKADRCKDFVLACAASILIVNVGGIATASEGVDGAVVLNQDAIWSVPSNSSKKVSAFGRYEGYTKALYTHAYRTSLYVSARDGTKLAVDVYRPAANGKRMAGKAPAVMEFTRYWRAKQTPEGRINSGLFGSFPAGQALIALPTGPDWGTTLVKHGYVVVVADTRGTGSSFGRNPGIYTRTEARDTHDLVEWIAAQSWSDGNVGLGGSSYTGTNQITALVDPAPHLKAIFPAVPNFELYKIAVNGGVVRKGGILSMYRTLVKLGEASDEAQPLPPPVDADTDGSMRARARAEHGKGSFSGYTEFFDTPAHDHVARELGLKTVADRVRVLGWNSELLPLIASRPDLQQELMATGHFRNEANSFDFSSPDLEKPIDPAASLDEINRSKVPAYYWSGWRDVYPTDALLFYANTRAPKKIAMGPWSHSPGNQRGELREEEHYRLRAIETLRWFDHWLKGIDNGIMKEPPINYAIAESQYAWEWRSAGRWPLAEASSVDMYFQSGPSGSVGSVNDGGLSASRPTQAGGEDSFVVDYAATSGTRTRFHDTTGGGPLLYPDLAANDAKGLTYTTEPLKDDLVIAGHVIVTLYATSTAPDGEFSVYLEDIDSRGYSTFLSDGYLRALNRTLGKSFYDNMGLPWPTDSRTDSKKVAPLSAGITQIQLVLESVGARLKVGHRMRVTVQGADADSTLTVPVVPAPRVTIARSSQYPSRITVPVLRDSQ